MALDLGPRRIGGGVDDWRGESVTCQAAEPGDPAPFRLRHRQPALPAAFRSERGGAFLREMAVFCARAALWRFWRFRPHGWRLYGLARAAVNAGRRVRQRAHDRFLIDGDRDVAELIEAAGWSPMARTSVKKQTATIALLQQIGYVLPRAIAAEAEANLEYRFHAVRGWRFDFAIPSLKIGLEIEGGLFKGHGAKDNLEWMARAGSRLTPADVAAVRSMGGRHNQPASMREDMIKYNEAAAAGWILIRVLPEMVTDGRAIAWLEAAVKNRMAA